MIYLGSRSVGAVKDSASAQVSEGTNGGSTGISNVECLSQESYFMCSFKCVNVLTIKIETTSEESKSVGRGEGEAHSATGANLSLQI